MYYGCLFVAKLNICMQHKKYFATKKIIYMLQKMYMCMKNFNYDICYKKYARKIYMQGFSVN